ncbi:MAG: TetR/AcrR family transcriptional regulator [Nocardioides sp.]|uniref:TetR/AcrR family transcriptional regulator n=1 Tax=Nocardioides sp. TaxID=35761 RepID=UPI003F127E8A
MARPPLAREKVLDAYVALLHAEGERAATMDAVAQRAGVSKGGLLYHFPSKEALAEAVLARFDEITARDLAEMARAPEGPSRHFVRTSWVTEDSMDHTYNATLRLAQAGHAAAVEALEVVHEKWLDQIRGEVGDTGVAEAIMLIGEGLYHQAAMPGGWSRRTFARNLDQLLVLVDRLKEA